MTKQNIYALFSDDPVDYTLKQIKGNLLISLIEVVRAKSWSQAQVMEVLKVTESTYSDLMQGITVDTTVDTLIEYLVRVGYKFESSLDTITQEPSFELKGSGSLKPRELK